MNRAVIEFARDRLRAIAEDEVLRQHFSLGYWGNQVFVHPVDQPEDPKCGFSGCFFGWAVHQQWFAKWGLELGFANGDDGLDIPDSSRLNICPMVLESSGPAFQPFLLRPGRVDAMGTVDAVSLLFGVSNNTMAQLIYEESYPDPDVTADDVVHRLNLLLAMGEQSFNGYVVDALEQHAEENAENVG